MEKRKSHAQGIRPAVQLALWGVLAAAAVRCMDIGPDSFGYKATDLTPFSFVDIASTGAAVLAGEDDGTASVNIGFAFAFYGKPYTSACISSNGQLSFGGCNADFANQDLTARAPAGDYPTIAPLWSDLTFAARGADKVYYQTLGQAGSRRFVVQWQSAYAVNGSKGITFQAVLHEADSRILFQYLDVDAGAGSPVSQGGSATVGIRDTLGQANGKSLQWSYKAPVLRNGQAIQFVWDTVAPATAAVSAPAANANGWNRSNVTIGLTATDNPGGSGVKQISYTLNGQTTIVPGSSAAVTVSQEGTATLLYSAVDNAGNQEKPKSLTVRIDKTPPVITGLPDPKTTLWPPNKKMIEVGVVKASDALSGLATFDVTGASNEPSDPKDPDIVITGSGLGPRTVQLRADRLGTGTGRIYSLTATATDLAGNQTTVKSIVTVPRDQGN